MYKSWSSEKAPGMQFQAVSSYATSWEYGLTATIPPCVSLPLAKK